MGGAGGSRWAIAVVLGCALGCSPRLIELPGAGGEAAGGRGGDADGGAAASGEGGATPGPRSIEVEMLGPGSFDREKALILVNAADGSLKLGFAPTSSPTTVEVVDGDVVSFLDASTEGPLMQSFRVTPDVRRIEATVEGGERVSCDNPPMQLTASVPVVLGADHVEVAVDGDSQMVSPPADAVFELDGCSRDVPVFAVALAGGEIVSYELVSGITYQPDASIQLTLGLSDTGRRTVPLQVFGLDGVEHLETRTAFTPGPGGALYDLNQVSLSPSTSSVEVVADVIDPPGGYLLTTARAEFSSADGACRAAGVFRLAPPDPEIEVDVSLLAQPEPDEEASFHLSPEGDRGDGIWQSWTFAEVPLRWIVHEDPERPPVSAVFPVLPEELPDGFLAPLSDPVLYSIGEEDYGDTEGFAEFAKQSQHDLSLEYRYRNYVLCAD